MTEAIAWPLGLALGGALLGSFIATLVLRWPRGESVAGGRSRCDGCGRTLSALELVPLASAAVLRGRCRSCRSAIDPRHWQIEATAALLGASAGAVLPGPAGVAGALFGWLLLTLAALDVAELWLPDRLTALLALAALLPLWLGLAPSPADRLIGGAAGFLTLWSIAAGYRAWRGRDGMGAGDPKLFGAIGLWLGWRLLPAVLLLASVAGLALALAARLRGQPVARDTALPLGALLAVAAYPLWLVVVAWPG